MKYYKTKSYLYVLVLLVLPLYFYFHGSKITSVALGVLCIFYYSSFSILSYLIRDNTLKVFNNLFSSEYVNIGEISKIERRGFIKSKYFSFDKIAIILDEGEIFKISPKEEQEFIKHLLSLNPNIEIKI